MDSYNQLEYDKIKKILANFCHSEAAKRFAISLVPEKDIRQIRQRQTIITEIQEFISRVNDYGFHNIADIRHLFDHYEHLAYTYPEFKKIYVILRKASELYNDFLKTEKIFADFPGYVDIVKKFILLPEIVKRYESIFSEEGEVVDTASPILKDIRKRQARIRQNVLKLLNNKINDKALEKVVQEKIITLRDDRYVIPLKEGTIGSVPGIIHGYSGSKATIFVEPNEAVGMNNEIHQLRQEEKEEIFRILQEFTGVIQEVRDDILLNYSLLCDLDFYFASARLGNFFSGTTPKITEKTTIKLTNARHPLLLHALQDQKKVIPFDLTLGESFDILILSGPNTGGKTVTLKAIGLLTLMALSGLPIPAASESEIGLFHQIFADIGDQQSLEDSLSTFSAHLRHIQEMLDRGDEKTLVLIDEIGAATDPEQGAALAQAIMEALISRKVTGVVTTHYTPLKIYALSSERCQNAAMQFDAELHIPTYLFKSGLPGNSFALEIAERLGLQDDILKRAKELTGEHNVELTDLLTRISKEKKQLAQNKFQYDLKLNLLNQKIKEYDDKLSQMEADKKQVRQEIINDSRAFLANLQRELSEELANLRKLERQERKKNAQKILKKVSDLNTELGKEEKNLQVKDLKPVTDPEVGEIVWVRDLAGSGEIVALEKKSAKIDLNGILFVTDVKNLYYHESLQKERTSRKEIFSSGQIKTEIKVLGMTFEDTLPVLETFIDEGYAAGLNMLRIVHGKGTGALRNKIRKYLNEDERVKDYYSPAPEAGGDGVTVVVLG